MFKNWLALVLLVGLGTGYNVSDFESGMLSSVPPSGFHQVDTGPERVGKILCIGDINQDQSHDYISTPNASEPTIYIYYWHPTQYTFIRQIYQLETMEPDFSLYDMVILDITGDGAKQLILTFRKDGNYSTEVYNVSDCQVSDQYRCQLARWNLNYGHFRNMTSVPFLLNLRRNALPSFLIFSGTERYVLENHNHTYTQKESFGNYMNTPQHTFHPVTRHFASNIDFTADCHADLVVLSHTPTTSILQFYERQTNSHFQLVKELEFPLPVQYYRFVDIDGSGTVDIVVVMSEDNEKRIKVLYNKVTRIDEMCVQNNDFPFSLDTMQQLSLPSRIAEDTVLYFGDINSDSFPDILGVFDDEGERRTGLYRNEEYKGQRVFKQLEQSTNVQVISEITDVEQVAFFDLGEDGKLDVIIMSREKGEIKRNAVINNVKDDTLFIKILPLSKESHYSAVDRRKSSSALGVTFQWRITLLNGEKQIQLLNQRSQLNFGVLELPYVCGGLGRTNNYVEDLTVSYQDIGVKMSWTPIIPNSQLLVYYEDEEWKLETLLSHTQRIRWVIGVSVSILIILGIIIACLNCKQNRQDQRDQYNFIQLIR